MKRVAAFITPHGFGHTTRAIAVLEALARRCPGLAFEIFTSAPPHLFHQSLSGVTIHPVFCDVGFIQHDALNYDLPATVAALDRLLPFSPEQVRELAAAVRGCGCVLCDIASLGILVAEAAGIPSILVENFTWDWIYHPLIGECPELQRHARTLAKMYAKANLRIQAEPVCSPAEGAIVCPPIFRQARSSAQEVRHQLGTGDRQMILVSLGGLDFRLPHWRQLNAMTNCFFVLAGQPGYEKVSENCLAIPHQSQFYHPDLIRAADLVVFKSGYSTVAECLQAGTRAVCIARPTFAESAVLARFVEERLDGTILAQDEFLDGSWLALLPELLARPRPTPAAVNGADRIAELLLSLPRG